MLQDEKCTGINPATMLKGIDGNKGFSLIELIIATAILLILSGILVIGINSSRKKETDKYVNELANQIRLTQTTAMSKAGKWRLALYLRDGDYYCVRELGKEEGDNADSLSWEAESEAVKLGHAGALNYQEDSKGGGGASPDGAEELIHVWRFNRDTGSCIEGAGTLTVTGISRTKYITVYRENGRCEISGTR